MLLLRFFSWVEYLSWAAESNGFNVLGQFADVNGNLVGAPIVLGSGTTSNAIFTNSVVNSLGELLVAWVSRESTEYHIAEKMRLKVAHKVEVRKILNNDQQVLFDLKLMKKAYHGKQAGHRGHH